MRAEITAIHERADDPIRTARAQAEVAHTMANADRPDAAIDYLKRADRILSAHPHPNPDVTTLHATILSDLGRIHAQLGRINTARNSYHRALALVVDTDDQTADRIRSLQAASLAR